MLCVTFLVTACSSSSPKNDEEIRLMLGSLLDNYDPMLRPDYLGQPVEVIVDATVLSISNIDEVILRFLLNSHPESRETGGEG